MGESVSDAIEYNRNCMNAVFTKCWIFLLMRNNFFYSFINQWILVNMSMSFIVNCLSNPKFWMHSFTSALQYEYQSLSFKKYITNTSYLIHNCILVLFDGLHLVFCNIKRYQFMPAFQPLVDPHLYSAPSDFPKLTYHRVNVNVNAKSYVVLPDTVCSLNS